MGAIRNLYSSPKVGLIAVFGHTASTRASALQFCLLVYIFRKVVECFHKLLYSIQKQAIIRLPATLMICSIVVIFQIKR